MKRIATLTLMLTLIGWGLTATAQPVRNGEDVIVARDIGNAIITLNGMLDEDVWDNAETIPLIWNGNHPLPGGGQFVEGEFPLAEPSDPVNATARFLREGNKLWIGVEVADASIGGSRDLWNLDGIIMSMVDRSKRPADFEALADPNYFGGTADGNVRSEFIYGWWNRDDTTATGDPLPGIEPVGFSSSFGPCGGCGVDAEYDSDAWDFVTTVNGIANDDNNGTGSPTPDEGYVMELFIDMARMGYDFNQTGGDKAPFSIAVDDSDYRWPLDKDNFFLSRVYWQFAYANNYNTGVGYIVGSPGVTVDSGDLEVTEPEYVIADASDEPEITLDGVLDEAAWDAVPYTFYMQYKPQNTTLLDANPGPLVPYYSFYFRPDINGDGNLAEVVDKTVGQFKVLHQGSTLYIGLDTDDQAISGVFAENGRDGFRLSLRNLDTLNTSGELRPYALDFQIDSMGVMTFDRDAVAYMEQAPGSIQGAVSLKGNSTVADPSDVDEGYQMEVAIDLTAFGYSETLSDERRVWTHLAFFDGDYLDVAANSYATRVWQLGERPEGASLYGYLDPGMTVANEDGATTPGELRLVGNYPNPFASRTQIRYELPQSGEVSVAVYDLLGRRVAEVKPGLQAAGSNAVTIDASEMASGVYFYRVQLDDAQVSVTGRMVVVK